MSTHKNVSLVEVNVEDPGAQADYMKLEKQGSGIPQVVLLDAQGKVVTQWVGFQEQDGVDSTLSKAMSGSQE